MYGRAYFLQMYFVAGWNFIEYFNEILAYCNNYHLITLQFYCNYSVCYCLIQTQLAFVIVPKGSYTNYVAIFLRFLTPPPPL